MSEKTAAIYTRVSTNEQAEHGYSLQSQIERCRSYAKQHGLRIIEVIRDDQSGAKLDRPGLTKLRDLIQIGRVNAVVVYSSDRLTRDVAHSILLRSEFADAGVDLHYCTRGQVEDSADGRLMNNIEAVFAEHWRHKIIEASRRGRRQKAANGKWPCDGHIAYGYRKEGSGRDAHPVINEEEAAVIRRIFAMYIGENGKPLPFQAIARTLTSEGVPPPNRGVGNRQTRGIWYKGTVRKIITRKTYIGEWSYGGIKVPSPDLAIIKVAVFERAQKRRKRSGAGRRRGRKYNYLMSGRMKCSCGLKMAGHSMNNGKHLYYQCNSNTSRRHARECEERLLRVEDADARVWAWFSNFVGDKTRLRKGLKLLSEHQELEVNEARERLDRLTALIQERTLRIEQLAKDLVKQQSESVRAALNRELALEGREVDALKAEHEKTSIEAGGNVMSEMEQQAILELADEISEFLVEASFERKRALVSAFDVQVELQWRGDQRGLLCSCSITLSQKQNGKLEPERTWLSLSNVCPKSSSTTIQSPLLTS